MAGKTRDRKPVTLENDLLATPSIGRGRSRRRLSDEEREVLVGMEVSATAAMMSGSATKYPRNSPQSRWTRLASPN